LQRQHLEPRQQHKIAKKNGNNSPVREHQQQQQQHQRRPRPQQLSKKPASVFQRCHNFFFSIFCCNFFFCRDSPLYFGCWLLQPATEQPPGQPQQQQRHGSNISIIRVVIIIIIDLCSISASSKRQSV